jgi:hypothetical protein
MTIDIKGRGAVALLYQAVRSVVGRPLSMTAAQLLAETVRPGSSVAFATGFPVRPWIDGSIGETDGPPGVAALARAVSTGLSAVPLICVPNAMREQMAAALRSAGVSVLDYEAVRRAVAGPRPTCSAAIIDYTIDPSEAEQVAANFMSSYAPVLLAAIEHPGANKTGTYHSSVGVDISCGVAKVEPLFALAAARGLPTLSFIDMPNELGAGAVQALAHEKIPFAKRCVCPCGAGMAASSRVGQLIIGTTANWAAYATVAALAVLIGRPEIAASRDHDARAIEAIMCSGGVEGVSGSIWPEEGVDGIATRISGHIVDLLAEVVRNALHFQAGKAF